MKVSGTQTDLTASNLLAVEDDYMKRLEELPELLTRHAKAYPEQEDLKNVEKYVTSTLVLVAILFSLHSRLFISQSMKVQ